MRRPRRAGFSLLEIVAAVVILAVVAAATVATVAPMRAKSQDKLADQEIASLNAMSQTYFLERGRFPASVNSLVSGGYVGNATKDERDRISRMRRDYSYTRTTGVFEKK